MSNHDMEEQQSWWKRVLIGILAIAFGLCAVAFPSGIMFGRILDVALGTAKPYSGSMTAIAVLLSLVSLVAIDGLVHLFATDAKNKSANRLRGIAGVAVAIAAIFWPSQTAYIAVEFIGLWAICVGILELNVARYSRDSSKDRALLVIAAVASILMGVGVMIWAFAAAVLISAIVGVAAVARGLTLIVSGFSERSQTDQKHAVSA